MANFCQKCGAKLKAASKFCSLCGAPVRSGNYDPAQVSKAPRCAFCGAELKTTSKFCMKCGQPVQTPARQQPVQQQPARQQPVQRQEVLSQSADPNTQSAFAPIKTGEVILGKFGFGSQLSTGKLITARLKEFPKSLGQFFKEPKKLIPVLVMVALWLITYLLRAFGVNGIPTKILSFFTFAGSSSFFNPLALLGGLVGKGIFAAAVTSIISLLANKKTQAPQPKRSFGEMLKGAFGVSGDTIFGWLCGIGAALIAYCFISGGNGLMSVMGGAAAAFTAARAAAGNGFVRQFIGSLKVKNPKPLEGVMRGMAVGFSAATVIGMIPYGMTIMLINGLLLLLCGGTLMILQATGVIKSKAKGAAAA